MNENKKTLVFVGVAVLAVGIAWASRPYVPSAGKDDVVNQPLAADLKDPLLAKSLEIIDFDESTGNQKVFKVAQVKGVWSLPSHYNYPADAQQQLGQAAASLMDLKILGVASELASDHAEFGVVDPGTAESGAKGVGKHITLADAGGKKLLDLIVGKEVKDQPKLRYVRRPGQDPVYVVSVSTDKLSTRFDDWIEKDLLKVNAWDIAKVFIHNYSIDEAARRQVPGEKLDLAYNDKESKWSLPDLKEGEELDATKLNEMKTAIDDLKIVDVRKKPAGLSRDLKTEEGIALDEQTVGSLISKGFWPTQTGDLLSNEGEVVAGTKEGVEYVLRFGEVALGTEEAKDEPKPEGDADKDASKKEGEAKEGDKKKGQNRYLFLMAQFNEDLIPKPELTPIPGEPAEQPAADAATQPAVEQPKAEGQAEEGKAEEAKADEPKPSEGPAAPDNEASNSEASKGEASKKEETKPGEANAETPAAPTENKDEAKKDGEKSPAEIERLKAENKRKQDEYNDKVKKGKEKVTELNNRFADWYYVISDDVYQKIHLHRADILKKPDAEKEAKAKDTPGEFNELKEGLQAEEEADAQPKAPTSGP